LLVAISRFCLLQTDGFTLAKIRSRLPFDPRWEMARNNEEARAILTQKFRYLAKGAQCYVFASEDNRYVIKFFRQKLYHASSLQREKKRLQKKLALEKDFQSYCLAYKELKEETGLLFLHLNKSRTFSSPLILIDKIGVEHAINPNDYEFFIQKKALLIPEQIEIAMKQGGAHAAKAALVSLFSMIQGRIDKEIADADANLKKNFGFCDGQAIQIDIGRFSRGNFSKAHALASLKRRKEDLHYWINATYPELSATFVTEFERYFGS
jgi:hypothetical protein